MDGFNSYLIIVDRVPRYIRIFLTISKSPPINVAQQVINKFKSTKSHRIVRTYYGGELAHSTLFETIPLEMIVADTSI